MKQLRLLFVWLIAWNTCNAQSYSFIAFTNSQGLPQSQVQCITQDNEGYLWVGTLGGLARFNGKKFTNYSISEGLFSNRITSLSFISGKLWIGHEGGFSVLSKSKKVVYKSAISNKRSSVRDIVQFGDKVVIADSYGGVYTMDKKWKLHRIRSFPSQISEVNDLLIVGKRLLLATDIGIFETTDMRHFTQNKRFPLKINTMERNDKGEIWVAGVYDLFRSDYSLTKKDSIPLIAELFGIAQCTFDKTGQLWLNSRSGMIRINQKGEQLFISDHNGLPVASIRSVFEDREGTIWCGSDGKGLLRFTGEQFVHYNEANGFPSELFLSVAKRKDGTYFFGSYDRGLFQRKGNGPVKPVPIAGTNIWSMETGNDGTIWCGTDIGLTAYRASGKIEDYTLGNEGDRVLVVERIGNKIYVGGAYGIGVIENGKFREIEVSDRFDNEVGSVRAFALYKGRVLCGSDKGIFDISDQKPKRILNFRKGVMSMIVDKANHLWVGTETGLYILRENGFVRHSIANDPASNTINFLEVIGNSFYIGTNNGLYVINSLSLAVEHHYGLNNGLVNLESNVGSSFYDGKFLWFGTAEGLIQFDPSLNENKGLNLPPLLNISSMLVNYNSFEYTDYATEIGENGIPKGLRLPYSMNNLMVELDGILLSNPEGLRYQFWLEGSDETWSKPVNNATVTLSNLPDGELVLHVRAMDEFGRVSNTIQLPVYIKPPFWRTWWFYGSIVVLVILGIRAFFRRRIRQERERNYKKNLEYKTRLLALEQQSLNASMNRHFIFNSLNSIQYFINTQDRISANKYLTNFAKLIRKNLDSAVEAENMVTLQQEIERLELYLSLEAMRFKDRFTYTINDNGIDTESIVVPGMLLQPFVENSIIHGILPNESIKGHIEVTVKKTDDHLEITIDDNGIGIDYSLQQKHIMLGDHKSQGMEITSKRIDIIRELSQKDFELEGPFQLYNPDKSIKGTRVLLKIPLENLED